MKKTWNSADVKNTKTCTFTSRVSDKFKSMAMYFFCFKKFDMLAFQWDQSIIPFSQVKLKFLYLFIFNYLRPRICMRAKCYFLLFLALVVIHIENKFFHDLRLLSSQPFCTTRSLCYYHKLAIALKWSVLYHKSLIPWSQ